MASGAIGPASRLRDLVHGAEIARASEAAIVQLTVPVIAIMAGWRSATQRALTLRLFIAGITILGGVAIVLTARHAEP